jgi:hypothetical protein
MDYRVSSAVDTLCFASQKNVTRVGINIEYTSTFRFACTSFHYSYSKTKQMNQFFNFIYFCITLYMFRTVFQSIIRSSELYIQQQAYVKQLLLRAASGNEMELFPSRSR